MTCHGYAIDLGGTKIAAARIASNQLVSRLQVATQAEAGLSTQMDTISALLEKLGHRFGDRLGVAVTGRLDAEGGWHAINTGTLPSIAAAPLLQSLRDRFGKSVVAVNDAAAAAYAEATLGAGRGATNFGYITVSTGVGGGLVLNGQLLNSVNGLAGHVGFSSSRLSDRVCGSGRMGTVESVAGGRAIAAAAGLDNAKAVFADTQFDAIIDRSAAAVAALVGDLTAMLGLDRVALGGSIGLAPGYLERVALHLAEEPELFRASLVAADLGQDSGMLGAMLLASSATG